MGLLADLERDAAQAMRAWELARSAMNRHQAAAQAGDWVAVEAARVEVEECFGAYLNALEAGYKRLESV
jgi:hypothetical protein